MTQTSYPFESTDTTEAQFSQFFRRLGATGVVGDPSTSDVKVSADSSGMNVKAAAGFAIVRGHFYRSDAAETLAIDAATSNPRRDLIILRLDPTANSIVLAVKKGTAAASPSDPGLTVTDEGVFELAVARVTVPANATTISAGDVTDLRTFTGEQFGRWSSALRPAAPLVGRAGFNTTLAKPEYWDGTAWVEFTPTSIAASLIPDAEQASIAAGRIRSGGVASNGTFKIWVQASQPTGAGSNDLWFW